MPNSLGLADWTIDGKAMDGAINVVEATYNVRDAKPVRVCLPCFRTHQDAWMDHPSNPTIKSE